MKHNLISALTTAIIFFVIINQLDASSDISMRVAAFLSAATSLSNLAAWYFRGSK